MSEREEHITRYLQLLHRLANGPRDVGRMWQIRQVTERLVEVWAAYLQERGGDDGPIHPS